MTTFVKVVENGGFSAAARALNMAPSMASVHVQSLEERLGVRLLNRTTRKVGVTEVGQDYYERCVQILAEISDADRIAQALQSTPRGTLRLNMSIMMPPFVTPAICEYLDLYPEVDVETIVTDRMIDLVEEGFDLSIRAMPVPDASLIVRRLATYRFVACATPEYLAKHGVPRQPADLAGHNCLVFTQSPWGNEWPFVGPNGAERVQVSGNLRSNSAEALRMAALRGQGLLGTTSFQVADEIWAGRLIPVLTEFLRYETPIQVFYPDRHRLPTKVRSFIDLLARHFRNDATWINSRELTEAA